MAFIVGVWGTGLLLYGLAKLLTSAESRRQFLKEVRDQPLQMLFVSVWVLFIIMFFWGVFIPGAGNLPLFGLKVWQVGGIGSLAGWILSMAVPSLR